MRLTFFKGVALGSVVAIGTLSATSAIAGTGVGSVFNLGKTNTVNATSSLKGSASGPMLSVSNSGNGTALRLKVGAGTAPMTVNSATQVPDLNASFLGGLSSANYIHGGGQYQSFGFTLSGDQNATLLTLPGYGSLTAHCGTTVDQVGVFFNAASPVEVWQNFASGGSTSQALNAADPSRTFGLFSGSYAPAWDQVLIHYTTVSGFFVVQHVATVFVAADLEGTGSDCHFVAEAITSSGRLFP